MHIVASFEYSTDLELALCKLETLGITKENILAIPLEESAEEQRLIDTVHSSDGSSLLDIGFVLAAIFMLLGAIYGFVLKWGPIVWGGLGLIFGMILGILLKVLFAKGVKFKLPKVKKTEVFIVINCKEAQTKQVKELLFHYSAMGVGYVK